MVDWVIKLFQGDQRDGWFSDGWLISRDGNFPSMIPTRLDPLYLLSIYTIINEV